MGRPKGSGNKTDELKAAIRRIEAVLVKSGHKGGLELMACRFLISADLKVASGVWARLMEWKWGKPAQPVTGEGGVGAIKVIVLSPEME
jgi:hypothetical protein